MTTQFDNIPNEMKNLRQWVCWKLVVDKDKSKPRKLPIDPKNGKSARTNDAATWGTFEQALGFLNRGGCRGIGFVFTADDPYVGIDLDNCRNKETGDIEPWAAAHINDFASYTEVSPSGTGVHIIVKGTLTGKGKKVGDVEIYDHGRYFTVTGVII